jgi:hypothetical protein
VAVPGRLLDVGCGYGFFLNFPQGDGPTWLAGRGN